MALIFQTIVEGVLSDICLEFKFFPSFSWKMDELSDNWDCTTLSLSLPPLVAKQDEPTASTPLWLCLTRIRHLWYASLNEFFVLLLMSFFGVMQTNDSGIASYVAGQIDHSLSWKVCQRGPSSLTYITSKVFSLLLWLQLGIYYVCYLELFTIDGHLNIKCFPITDR